MSQDQPEQSEQETPIEEPREAPESSAASSTDASTDARSEHPNGDRAGEGFEEHTETTYDEVAGGHRVTRRTVRRREFTEHVDETITEDVPLQAYQAPAGKHPNPVG